MTALCTPAEDVVVTLRGETFHPSEGPFILLGFDPWTRGVRADAEDDRAWADGAWSGAEWVEAATVPITVLVRNLDADPAGAGLGPNRHLPGTARWLVLHQRLAAAFAPSHTDIALEFTVGGTDTYLLYGRPRGVEVGAETAFRGWTVARCQFRCLDPTIYAGGPAECVTLTLPEQTGGLTLPTTAPITITATVATGRAIVTNEGTAAAHLEVRIDGPCTDPRLTVLHPDASVAALRYHGALTVGQWLDIDTRAHTCLLNGTASRRGLISGDWPLLDPGDNELAFDATVPHPDARLTACWRSAWL